MQEHTKRYQPILIGTTSIIKSDEVAEILDKNGMEYMLLNAKSVEKEAELIANAGQRGRITIATNMAGRGTDILLGDGVNEIGGLHVIGTERNESERIDNQLKSSAGRQGDNGTTMFIVSLEDNLFIRYAADELERLMPKIKAEDNGLIKMPSIHKFVETAQRIAEGVHAQFREYNLQLESVLNKQREVIYEFRDTILDHENILDFIIKQIETVPEEIITAFCNTDLALEEMDLSTLSKDLNQILLTDINFTDSIFEDITDLEAFLTPFIQEHFKILEGYSGDEDIESSAKGLSLYVIDGLWKKHLDTMAQLKEGIGIRQYKQEDPVQLFEKEGYDLFENLFNEIKFDISKQLALLIKQVLLNREQEEANE